MGKKNKSPMNGLRFICIVLLVVLMSGCQAPQRKLTVPKPWPAMTEEQRYRHEQLKKAIIETIILTAYDNWVYFETGAIDKPLSLREMRKVVIESFIPIERGYAQHLRKKGGEPKTYLKKSDN